MSDDLNIACAIAFDLGMELGRKELLLESALFVGERHRAMVVKLIDSHGEMAVELGSALFALRKSEERLSLEEGLRETISELQRALSERNAEVTRLSAINQQLRLGTNNHGD